MITAVCGAIGIYRASLQRHQVRHAAPLTILSRAKPARALPVRQLEAIACGMHVFATPVWGTPDLPNAAPDCVLTADRSPEAVAAGVRKLLSATVNGAASRPYAEHRTWPATARHHDASAHAAIVQYRASMPASGARA